MTPASSRRRMRAATDGADRLTRLAIWLNDSRASRWIWPMMAQSVGSRSVPMRGMLPGPYVANTTRCARTRLVHDGGGGDGLAMVQQVTAPIHDQAADPPHGMGARP